MSSSSDPIAELLAAFDSNPFDVDAHKRSILESAATVFAEYGYDGSSLAKISHACGLSQAGLLHHYPSKKDLLIAVLEYRDAESARLIASTTDEVPSFLQVAPQVSVMFAAGLQNPSKIALFHKITAEATHVDHPGHAWALRRLSMVVAAYRLMLQVDADDGRLVEGISVEWVARLIVATMDGLQLQFLVQGDSFDAAGAFDTFVVALVAQISA